jgi:hypothetical protein
LLLNLFYVFCRLIESVVYLNWLILICVDMEKEVEKMKAEMEKEVGKVEAKMNKEAEKVKIEMDNEIAKYHKEIEIGEIKFQDMKKNYQTILACSWILFVLYMLFFYTLPNTSMTTKLVV